MIEISELTKEDREYLINIPEVKTLNLMENLCKLNYFGKKIYFYKIKEEVVGNHDCWVNYTGLSSNRPKIIIDHLVNKGCLKENMSVLDVGCGLSEIGVEINRQFKDNMCYQGLDINKNLQCINRLNFADSNNYKFNEFDLTNSELLTSLNHSYDIVTTCGAATQFFKIFAYISSKIKPKYIVCESHIGRNRDLENIISQCKNYKVIDTFNFKYESINGPDNPNWIGYKRQLYILEIK